VAQGRDSRLERTFPREDDGVGLRRLLLAARDHADAVEPRHVEVDDDAVVGILLQRGDGRDPVGTHCHAMAEARQLEVHELLQRRLVVGEQQGEALGVVLFGSDNSTP
jgi:hypothetical protein